VVHYCVTNMPGAVARTSTYGLTNATLKRALAYGTVVASFTISDFSLGGLTARLELRRGPR